MLFGLDGVELGLIITFACLFGAIMSGFPVAFAIGGAGVLAFGIIASLDSAGILVHLIIDPTTPEYAALIAEGVRAEDITRFRYPDLPRTTEPLFDGGWERALDRTISFIPNRMNERVIAGPSIETLLAVPMFVLMGITLERSKIANDLLTTMARIFGPLPGGLAVSVVVVGAFLAASTGIVGATVVTMGLLSLPTMLRSGYSPQLATGVISASGTLGQIIPPSIVIVLLGTLAGDIYSTAQEERARSAGCNDALTYLGEPAVLSVGTLFQAAILPGIFLAFLYGLYAFCFALVRPSAAPAVTGDGAAQETSNGLLWFLVAPAAIIAVAVGMSMSGVAGSQSVEVSNVRDLGTQAELRTNVGDQCRESMIALHGQAKWDRAVAMQADIDAAGGAETQAERERSPEEIEAARAAAIENAPPISSAILPAVVFFGIAFAIAAGVSPGASPVPLIGGAATLLGILLLDWLAIGPTTSAGTTFLIMTIPTILLLLCLGPASRRLFANDLIRVVFPPLVLIVAVLGSILGGITNPTPAAALGAAGAIMLAAVRKLHDADRPGGVVLLGAFSIVVLLLFGVNFDLRVTLSDVSTESWVAWFISMAAYHVAMAGLVYACIVLAELRVLGPVVRETAKVTSMVFAILIGSQILNLVIISFGGEHYIQEFLRSIDNETAVFLLVMLVLFILGFVLDFLEIIYIVVPIVGPVIYGGTLDPAWVTIMIAINLQTSFLTPPFGFALFYLRGVAPPQVTTGHIYRGVVPFVLIQVVALSILWFAPGIVTIVPDLLR